MIVRDKTGKFEVATTEVKKRQVLKLLVSSVHHSTEESNQAWGEVS